MADYDDCSYDDTDDAAVPHYYCHCYFFEDDDLMADNARMGSVALNLWNAVLDDDVDCDDGDDDDDCDDCDDYDDLLALAVENSVLDY